ncbi:MAG TPA: hypothetical protein DCF68_05315 [Cyanothece sp. UBA12306]|nr:hypothetical protein [Cyanothece sp. UBA12306]
MTLIYLKQWQQSQEFLENRPNAILLMGLGGSLSAKYRVGEGILCLQCSLVQAEQKPQWKDCDQKLNKLIKQHFGEKIRQGRLITSDRLIYLAREKQELGKWYQADVVDMEGIVLLDFCNSWQIPLVVIRVISDDYRQNLPNLTPAFEANGTLNPLLLTRQMLQNPLNSAHLIVCSLIALRKLQQIAKEISLM